MARLNTFPVEFLDALLATEKMSVADAEFSLVKSTKIPVDKHHRTLLIGLGGTGINTIEHVKGEIKNKLADGWDQYVAFLGIDTDNTVRTSKIHIQSDEYINITRVSLKSLIEKIKETANSANANTASWPTAWHRFADREVLKRIQDPDGEGAGRKRFLGKAKLHYKENTSELGVDEEIINKLSQIFAKFAGGKIQIYVIGSIYGGTGSGTFLEIPALVKRAAGERSYSVNAMLYLPDTIVMKYPDYKNAFEANGYASLKELNYYQGISMRPGYSETWSINDRNNSDITIDNEFFEMPYLIGTPNGPTRTSIDEAQKAVAEFFISTLGNMQSSNQGNVFLLDAFKNNADQERDTKDGTIDASGEEVLDGSAHEHPRHFCALGFARAATPTKSITAYAISEACAHAGFLPVDDDELATIKNKEGAILPFLGSNQTYQPDDGMRIAKKLIKPLEDFVNDLRQPQIDESKLFPASVTGDAIRSKSCYDEQIETEIQTYVSSLTDENQINALKVKMQEKVAAVKENIKAYVKKDGPHALWSIYRGYYSIVKGVENIGMNEMIRRLCYGQNIENADHFNAEAAVQAKKDAFKSANDDVIENGTLLKKALDVFTSKDAGLAETWKTAKIDLTKAQVAAGLDQRFIGTNKILDNDVRKVLEMLAEQIRSFGEILDCLSRGYGRHADSMKDLPSFRSITGESVDVNIAALDQRAFNWVREQADASASRVDAKKLRDEIIDDFFADPDQWLVVDDNAIRKVGETYGLVNPERPANARIKFDKCVSAHVKQQTVDVSFDALFNVLETNGVSYDEYAENIVEQLIAQSKPRIHATLSCPTFMYLMYPASMEQGDSIRIVNALKQAVRNRLPNSSIEFYKSDYNDGITMYQLKAPFELYQLGKSLNEWEAQYNGRRDPVYGQHGKSPDVTKEADAQGVPVYNEREKWFGGYPPITLQPAGVTQKRGGTLSIEGERRVRMNKIIDKALKYGILYPKKEGERFSYYVARFSPDVEWRKDIDRLPEDGGRYPEGIDLVEATLAQNRISLDEVSVNVTLAEGGLLEKPADSEARALSRARTVLYSHMPMFIEMRTSIELMEDFFDEVYQANGAAEAGRFPAMFVKLIKGNVVYLDENKCWKLRATRRGMRDEVIVKMDDESIRRRRRRDPFFAGLEDAGLSLFVIYKKFEELLEEGSWDAMMKLARENEADAMDDDLDEWDTIAEELLAQRDAIEDYGADLEAPQDLPRVFKKKMSEFADFTEEELVEIATFYKQIDGWKKIR